MRALEAGGVARDVQGIDAEVAKTPSRMHECHRPRLAPAQRVLRGVGPLAEQRHLVELAPRGEPPPGQHLRLLQTPAADAQLQLLVPGFRAGTPHGTQRAQRTSRRTAVPSFASARTFIFRGLPSKSAISARVAYPTSWAFSQRRERPTGGRTLGRAGSSRPRPEPSLPASACRTLGRSRGSGRPVPYAGQPPTTRGRP